MDQHHPSAIWQMNSITTRQKLAGFYPWHSSLRILSRAFWQARNQSTSPRKNFVAFHLCQSFGQISANCSASQASQQTYQPIRIAITITYKSGKSVRKRLVVENGPQRLLLKTAQLLQISQSPDQKMLCNHRLTPRNYGHFPACLEKHMKQGD